MSKWCGGIRFDDSMKIMKGVICDAESETVDVTKAVSTCGQLWDGATFKVEGKVITLVAAEEGAIEPIKGNCGVGLDGRYFKLTKGVASLEKPVQPEPEPEEPRGDM